MRWSLAAALLLTGCTVTHSLDGPPLPPSVARAGPLDILIVIDNSGSMDQEHTRLREALFADDCPPLSDDALPDDPGDLEQLSRHCGITQLLQAVGSDFHLAIISSDVGLCDERLSFVMDPDDQHTPRPMRGCLQSPGIITRETRHLDRAFEVALTNVGVYGSAFERGFDAAEIFLTPAASGSRRAPSCVNDDEGFLRPDGRLLVLFVSDENDCSHRDGAFGFTDELQDEPQTCGDFPALFTGPSPASCQTDAEHLTSITNAASFYTDLIASGRTTDVLIGVLGGGSRIGDSFVAGGCLLSDGAVSTACVADDSTGNRCLPADPCCEAVGSQRQLDLARALGTAHLSTSICSPDYREALLPLFTTADRAGLVAGF